MLDSVRPFSPKAVACDRSMRHTIQEQEKWEEFAQDYNVSVEESWHPEIRALKELLFKGWLQN